MMRGERDATIALALGTQLGRARWCACWMTVSDDPMDLFGLSAFVAPCVSRLTEGAQSERAL